MTDYQEQQPSPRLDLLAEIRLTARDLDELRQGNIQDRKRIAAKVLGQNMEENHACSLDSLDRKLEILRYLQEQYGVKVLPDVDIDRNEENDIEVSRGTAFYHHSIAGHHNNEDALVSVVSMEGSDFPFQIHGLFDGVSQCPDGRQASSIAAEILKKASQLGLGMKLPYIALVAEGINAELHRRNLQTTGIILGVNEEHVYVSQMGDSYIAMYKVDDRQHAFLPRNKLFLGAGPIIHGEPRRYGRPSSDRVFILMSDGFLESQNRREHDPLKMLFDMLPAYLEEGNFIGIGRAIQPPEGTKHVPWHNDHTLFGNMPKEYHGPSDDASLLLAYVSGKK